MYYLLGLVLCFVLIVINIQAAVVKKVSVDIGKNVTIKCPISNAQDVDWRREGKKFDMTVLGNGSLFLKEADTSYAGIYTCIRENDVMDLEGKVNLTVRTPPPPLIVSIKPSTILVLILWKVNGTGGYPILYFTAEYRAEADAGPWIPITPIHIMPNARQVELYNLTPNTTYEFRMWAANQLGASPIVTVLSTTRSAYPESELARHFLKGAETFDTRWWAAAVGIVMGSLVLLGIGTCVLLYMECRTNRKDEEEPEIIELVPNIILNPGFEGPNHFNDITPDENSNNETPERLNNNSVVQPQNL